MSRFAPNYRNSTNVFWIFGFGFGDIAQLVEQMTFNHWVQGSSPCVPTRNSTATLVVFLYHTLFIEFFCAEFAGVALTPFNNCSKRTDIDASVSIQSITNRIIFSTYWAATRLSW